MQPIQSRHIFCHSTFYSSFNLFVLKLKLQFTQFLWEKSAKFRGNNKIKGACAFCVRTWSSYIEEKNTMDSPPLKRRVSKRTIEIPSNTP